MSNPWNLTTFHLVQTLIRLVLWVMLAVNSAMLCIFSVGVLYKFLTFLWEYLLRTWFAEPW